VLPSLVIKIEYRRTLHKSSVGLYLRGDSLCLNEFISRRELAELNRQTQEIECPVTPRKQTTAPSSNRQNFQKRDSCLLVAGRDLRNTFPRGSCVNLYGIHTARPDEGRERTFEGRPFLSCELLKDCTPVTSTLRVNPNGINPACPDEGRERICEGRADVFLTGSASQTKCAVTRSKQTLEKILTGARTAIKLSRFFQPSGSVGRFFLMLAALFLISLGRSSAGNLPPSYLSPGLRHNPSRATAPAAAAEQSSIPELFASGEAALRSGNLNEAETSFKQVLAQDPNSAGAYANLGVIAMRRQNWSQALDLLRKSEKLAPSVAGIRLNIGLVYYRQNEFHSAIAPFESVVRDQPTSVQARYLLGLCYFFTDRYADAVRVLQDLWPQESQDLNYLYVLGNAADKAGNTALQERALTRFVELGQNTAEYHLLMGKAFLNREENDKAVAEFRQAAQSDPNLPFVHFNLGLAYLVRLDFAHAKEEFEKDIALEPDVAFNYDRLGLVYVYLQDDEKAEQNFREALRRDSHLASSYFGLARVYQHEKKFDDALVAIDSAEKIDPDNPNYHNLEGQILLRLGRTKEGQAELDSATRLLNSSRARRQSELSGETLPQPELTAEPKP